MSSDRIFVGWEATSTYDLPATLEKVYEEKMNAVIVPLFHPRFKRDSEGVSDARDGPQSRSDLVLDSRGWTSSIIGGISKWINLDSLCPRVRLASEKVLKQEVAWATHLSVSAALLPTPSNRCPNYARTLNQCAIQAQYLQFWVRVPLTKRVPPRDDVADDDQPSSWDDWNALRSLCEFNPKVSVALEITADLPSAEHLKRWLGEPVKAVIIPTDIFLTNRHGYPALSQRHQSLLFELFRFNIQYYLSGKPRHQGRLLPYVQYLHFLFSKKPSMDPKALFEAPYLDYLQAPLQPLMDNLESQTYETFEQDNFKYDQYEKAVTKALLATPEDKVSIVMVVGAGRGPLVRCSLRAAAAAKRATRMYAVEKNPNAVITLRNLKVSEKWDNVTIVASDMRHWNATEKADIMVSELLGSFSDNELSPECLDGAQAFLKEDGISIPASYTSYVAPIMSSKLWYEVKAHEALKHFETPYVVRLHNIYTIDDPQPCFTFEHPKFQAKPIDNRRDVDLRFHAKSNAVVHGFAGYFESVLYGDVTLSILPATHSDGMFSWFPIYFPLREPMNVGQDEELRVSFWRLLTSHKVWYEWAIQNLKSGVLSPIHNPNGRSYWIGL